MNIQLRREKSEHGSVLLIVVAICVILGLSIAGYLALINFQYRLAVASQAWNTALTLSEAGIEDGMAQINLNFGTNYTPSAQTNWSLTGSVYGPRTLTMFNGSFSAIILSSNPCPTIISTGYVSIPYTSQTMRRVVQVTTTNTPAFGAAVTVKNNIDLKGNNVTVDSYDSTDPLHSTNGVYDPNTRKAGGDIASAGGLISVQNANIYGKLSTGPGGSYSVGSQGSVGDLGWAGGVEPGWYANDFNLNIRDVGPPYTAGVAPVKQPSGTNTYILAGSDYYVNSDFDAGNTYVSGNARLYVTGNFNGSLITLAPGATLKVYIGTPSGPSVSASLSRVNATGDASSFQVWGLPSLTSIGWNGNDTYTGTIYAPEADVTAGGGGSSALDIQGSIVANSLRLNGHFSVHYDENLKRSGPASNFTVISWREL